MQSKTFLKNFLLFFQIIFISASIVVENNQDLETTLNFLANKIEKQDAETKLALQEIAELKLVKHDIEIKLTSIQSKIKSKLKYENFPKYTILTVGSEEIFNYFIIRLILVNNFI